MLVKLKEKQNTAGEISGLHYISMGELFSGPGGGALGASLASVIQGDQEYRIKHIWANDIDSDSCKTYKKNIEATEGNQGIKVICGDVREEPLEDINKYPYVDGLFFGFPCNDFSIVGETKGLDGEFGPLYKQGIRILKREAKPNWFVAENVSGLSSANEGLAFQEIIREMKGAGYVCTAHKYKFEEYGVPQARHRIIIVGIRKELGKKFKVPVPFGYKISAKEALDEIPLDAAHHEFTNQSDRVVQRLNHIRPGENAWTANLPEALRLNVKGAKLSHIYKRIEPNKPSYTVTGSGGGGTHMYHWNEPRALTNRERARLQTFPDVFEFVGGKESIRKQIGMAIPPQGAKVIFEALLKTLCGQEYKYIQENIKTT